MSTKFKQFFSNLGLKLTLFRIWFVKNIMLFIMAFLLISLILMFTGCIHEDTFILGKLIYPLFSPLIDSINKFTAGAQTLMDVLAVILSVLTTIGLFSIKVKNIAITDIKNKKLKLALIRAGLYFNEEGKLVKKEEGKNGEEFKFETREGIFSGIVRAADELKVVVSATEVVSKEEAQEKLRNMNNEENIQEETQTMENNELIPEKTNEEAGIEIVAAAAEGSQTLTEGMTTANDAIQLVKEISETEELTPEEKASIFREASEVIKRGFVKCWKGIKKAGSGIWNAIKKIFKKKEKSESDSEVINGDQDIEVIAEQPAQTQPAVQQQETTETSNTEPEQPVQQPATKTQSAADDFMARLRGIK